MIPYVLEESPTSPNELHNLWYTSPYLTLAAEQWGLNVISERGYRDFDQAIDQMMNDINEVYDHRYYNMIYGAPLDENNLAYDAELLSALFTLREVRAYVSVLSNLAVHPNTPANVVNTIGSAVADAHLSNNHTKRVEQGWWNTDNEFLDKAHLALADEVIISPKLEYPLFEKVVAIPGVVMYAGDVLDRVWETGNLAEFRRYARPVAAAARAEAERVDTLTEAPIEVYETLTVAPLGDPETARNAIELGFTILRKASETTHGPQKEVKDSVAHRVLRTLNPNGESFLTEYLTEEDMSRLTVAAAML